MFCSQWLGPPPEECDLSSEVEAGLKELAPEADGTTTVLATAQWVLSWRRAEWPISKSATVLPVCHMSPLIHTHLGSPYPEFECPSLCEGTLRRMIWMWIKYDPFHSGVFQVFPEMESLVDQHALSRILIHAHCPELFNSCINCLPKHFWHFNLVQQSHHFLEVSSTISAVNFRVLPVVLNPISQKRSQGNKGTLIQSYMTVLIKHPQNWVLLVLSQFLTILGS